MADLRIVDAPVLLQESITDDVKMPTGGLGNYAIRLGDILWYVITKEQLANKNYVDLSSKGVKDKLDEHIADKANPHKVTKEQVGLGNVDNTADIDKPVSNATKSAIITATTDMATKAYVNQKDNLKADKVYVDGKDGDLTTLTTTDKTNLVKAINEVVSVKADKATTLSGYGISDAYTKSEIDTNYGGVKTLYDKNVAAGAGANGWTDTLIALHNGRNQRDRNADIKTLRDYLTESEITDTKKTAPTIDIAGKLQAAFNDTTISSLILPDGVYYINKPVVCTRDFYLTASANAYLKFGLNGSLKFEGSATLLGNPATDIVEMQKSIQLTNASNLISAHDWLCIYNPTDFSWSPHRAFYRAGEFIQVSSVNGNTIKTYGDLVDSYLATAVNIYKINAITVNLTNIKVIAENDGVANPITMTYVKNGAITNYENRGSSKAGLSLVKCLNLTVSSGSATNDANLNGNNYGIVVANCFNINIDAGSHHAARHAIALGGGVNECSVPCRLVKISNALLRTSSNGLGASDMHGNCEFITYQNCSITHANMAGRNNKYVDCTIYGREMADGSCIWGGETSGGDHDIIDCTFITDGDGGSFGFIYLATEKFLVKDLTIRVKNLRIKGTGGGNTAKLVQYLTTVDETKKVNIIIEGVESTLEKGIGIVCHSEQNSNRSYAIPSDFMIVDKVTIVHPTIKPYLIYPTATAQAAKTRQMQQSGSVVVTSVANAKSIVAAKVNLNYIYSKPPTIQVSMSAIGSTVMTENYLNAAGSTEPLMVVTPYNAAISDRICRPGLLSNKALPADKQFLLSWATEINEV